VPDRSEGGERVYRPEHVRRLAQVVALRGLGLSLGDVAELLDEQADPEQALRRRLGELEREIQERLRRRLARLVDALDSSEALDPRDYIDAIEVMAMIDKHYIPSSSPRSTGDGETSARRAWPGSNGRGPT
jgi:DNA-binding transcriptional MerR regulator